MRVYVLIASTILPWSIRRRIFGAYGWRVHPSARVGFSVIVGDSAVLERGVRIGHFNIIKGFKTLHIEEEAYIRHFNHIFGQTDTLDGPRLLLVGRSAQIMSRHFFDLTGSIHIGKHSVLGGRDTQIWTHSRRQVNDNQYDIVAGHVEVGPGVYVGARSTLVECNITEGSIVAAGSVVSGSVGRQTKPRLLYRGNPASTTFLR